MPDYDTIHTAERCVPCTDEEFRELQRLLSEPDEKGEPERFKQWQENDSEFNGFDIEGGDGEGEVYLCSENGTADQLPRDFCEALGKLIGKANLPYLEVCWAATCSRLLPGSHHGGAWRLYPDGSIKFAELVFASDRKEQAAA